MKLADWLKKNKVTGAALAAATDVTAGAVSRWLDNSRVPRRETITKISKFTKGKVTAADFYQ